MATKFDGLCAFCGLSAFETADGTKRLHIAYCNHCFMRYQRLNYAYQRAGKKLHIQDMHRARYEWRVEGNHSDGVVIAQSK